jgi:hypothetical protein
MNRGQFNQKFGDLQKQEIDRKWRIWQEQQMLMEAQFNLGKGDSSSSSGGGQFAILPSCPPGMVTVAIPEEYLGLFDLGDENLIFGCWIKITDSVGPSTIFSFGEYPSTWQALTIENGNLIFWYSGEPIISADITPYVGQWAWICLTGFNPNFKQLFINGIEVGSSSLYNAPIVGSLYIGSGNAPNTYFNGLIRDFVFCVIEGGLEIPPTEPLSVSTCTPILLLFQGTDLTQQLTDNGLVGEFTVTNSGAVYNADSPYAGYEGSTKFGAPCS